LDRSCEKLTYRVKNGETLGLVKEEMNIPRTVKRRKAPGLATACVGTAF